MRTLSLRVGTFLLWVVACNRSPNELPPHSELPNSEPRLVPLVATALPVASPSTSAQTVVPFFQGEKPIAKEPPTPDVGRGGCPRDPQPGRTFPKVSLKVAGVANTSVDAEFALAAEDSERGLMFRTEMPADAGMIFKLKTKVQTFWMHNTCLSLDMLFLDDAGVIVGFLEKVPTLNDEPRSIGKPTPYVLELNAGYIAKHGLKLGQRWILPAEVQRAKPPN
jgi:uncharacterized protein